jgi:hypothetical protein
MYVHSRNGITPQHSSREFVDALAVQGGWVAAAICSSSSLPFLVFGKPPWW